MYEEFYNLKADPFEPGADNGLLYEHGAFAKAQTYMSYAFMFAEGFAIVTGRPGAGKTTLAGKLIEHFSEQGVKTVNLVSNRLREGELLKIVADELGIKQSAGGKDKLLEQLDKQLRQWQHDDIRALLVVDEAQGLAESEFEDLLHLTNMGEAGKPLLQIFLVGQPELRDILSTPSMEQVRRRTIADSQLEALEEGEVEPYILHRLEGAGWRGDPSFSKDVFPLVHEFSEGLPGKINLLCSRLLARACTEEKHEIGVEDARAVIETLEVENLSAEVEADASANVADSPAIEQFDPHKDAFNAYGTSEDEPAADDAVIEPAFLALESDESSGEPDESTSKLDETTGERDESLHENWIAVGAGTTRIDHRAPRPHARAKNETRPRGGNRAWYIGLISIAALVLWAWLTYGSGLEVVSVWREKVDGWWQPVAAYLQPAEEVSLAQAPELEVDSASSDPELEVASLAEAEVPAPPPTTAQIQTPTTTATIPGHEAETGGELESKVSDTSPAPAEALAIAESTANSSASGGCTEKLQVNFARESSSLSDDAKKLLNGLVAQCLVSGLNKVRVTGYTDTFGDWDYNLRLSRRRAENVAQYLISRGVDSGTIFAEGLGEYGFDQAASAADTTTDDDRRIVLVEILVPADAP